MQISKNEISKYVSCNNLCDDLTFSGLEVETCLPAAGEFSKVVVGKITAIAPHPDAERLQVCTVNIGSEDIQVVTNLQSVFVGLRLPVALVGATLADGMQIKASKLRGVASNGMFCSCESLGMQDSSLEILEFSEDIAPGSDLRAALDLDDEIIDIAITPNRGDCLSYRGIARQLAAYTDQTLDLPELTKVKVSGKDLVTIKVNEHLAPVFAVRKINNIKPGISTPLHIVEFLRRSGIRSVNLVVDCCNMVMLKLGTPMHAYAADKITGGLEVRFAKAGESVTLLNDNTVSLQETDIVVADDSAVQALAGLMGAKHSGVEHDTSSIILEAAIFTPELISQAVRQHRLSSDSAYRFERGVDWQLCEQALDLASELISSIAGGEICPISSVVNSQLALQQINLRYAQVARLLGQEIAVEQMHNILQRLGCSVTERDSEQCNVTVPSFRPDLTQECDLIEEIFIISGVNNLPPATLEGNLLVNSGVEPAECTKWRDLYRHFASLGFNEAITYSFIPEADFQDFAELDNAERLSNPISQDMAVMRPSLLPGLLRAMDFNNKHQAERIQMFEIGQCFSKGETHEQLAGVLHGSALPAQWSRPNPEFDIFDCKCFVLASLASLGLSGLSAHKLDPSDPSSKAWHPGRSFDLLHGDVVVARVGQLHPSLEDKYGAKQAAIMFTIALDTIQQRDYGKFQPFSEQPAIRRDIAIILKSTLESKRVIQKILEISGDLLENIHVFDVYQGQGVESGCKSVGLNLTFRAQDRTLVEEEINNLMQQILEALDSEFGAKLRM